MARELSIFVDESGDRGGKARYYLLTLVFHEQSVGIDDYIRRYRESLNRSGLPDIPFHSEPLLNGHKQYEFLTIEQRKRMLTVFATFVRHLPIRYASFVYRRSEFADAYKLSARMKRDISNLFFNHLESFQSFEMVKIYYDNGQDIVKQALDKSLEFALSRNAVIHRKTSMVDYRLG